MPPSLHRSPTLPLASNFLATPSTRLSPALIRALLPFDLLIVPGLFGSDEDHWQSIWENVFRAHGLSVKRVAQDNWSTPSLSAWQAKLDETLKEAKRPVLLLAHSLGAVLTVHHGARHPASAVAGALLVAPADGEQHKGPDAARIESFMPLPAQTLPFPSTVIFSRNDPWLTPDRAQTFGTQWGSTLVDGGYSGHMGNNAGLEHWPLGLNALHSLALTCHAGQVHAHA